MKTLIFLLFATVLLLLPCSAEEITFEILQNSNDEYYISYNDDLIACVNDTCAFDVANYTTNTTGIELSRTDMKKIAQYVALEIEVPEYIGAANESFITTQLGTSREDTTDNLRAFITNTVMPSIAEIDEVNSKLTVAEVTIADLQSKANEYDALKETTDKTISVYEDERKIYQYLCGILTLSFIGVLGFNSPSFKRMLELKRSKR